MTTTNPRDEELFQDAFGEWLKLHGVELSPMLVGNNKFVAHIDLNELKPAIIRLIHAHDATREREITRFEVIDHRECVWCRGRRTANYLQKNGDYKELPCDKCDGSGTMGGRVYGAFSNAETSTIKVELSYQDDDRTLKVFVTDLTNPKQQTGEKL